LTSSSREPKRDAVRRVAAEVFLEKGFGDTSIQDIADRLGMTKGGAYYHIQSKEEVLYDVLMSGMRMLLQRVEMIYEYPLSASDRLRLAMRENVRSIVEECHASLVITDHTGEEFLTAEHRLDFNNARNRYISLFVMFIEEAVSAGEFRPVMDAKILVLGIFGMLRHIPRWYRQNGRLTINEISDIFWDFTRCGLAVAEPRHDQQ